MKTNVKSTSQTRPPSKKRRGKRARHTPSLNLPKPRADVAGADIGAREIALCVPEGSDPKPVRIFATFTADLGEAIQWLKQCGVHSVAMESTALYWLPFAQLLAEAGIEIVPKALSGAEGLANARHVRHLPGLKSDVLDCQWIQYLHSVGLIRGSFRPADELCALRSLTRHRDNLIAQAADQVRYVHSALVQMNIQIQHVIDDITGATGSAIIEAILAGERDPGRLAQHRDRRIKATRETITKSLHGHWREEHLLVLRLAWESRAHFQSHAARLEEQIQRRTAALQSAHEQSQQPAQAAPAKRGKSKNQPAQSEEMRAQFTRLFGVDLTQIPTINVLTVQALLAEIGPDFRAFPNEHAIASWAGLCPGTKISGGRRLSKRTRRGKPRIATMLRQSALSLHSSKSALGAKYRRLRARLGAPKALTAMAHLILKIIYKLVREQIPYDESIFAQLEKQHEQNRIRALEKTARNLGYTLTKAEATCPDYEVLA